jgi:D-glycerate 3-kinase
MSLDDFYLPRAERLARGLEFRAQPGSHDLVLLDAVLDDLTTGRQVEVPRFSGALDDRTDPVVVTARPDLVILEGWLLGYSADAYAAIRDRLDVFLFLETDADVARERRFEREDVLRRAGGGLSEQEMQRFWDEVLSPGLDTWVADARRHADVVVRVDDGPSMLG